MSKLDEFTREYSSRLGVLTGAQIQTALDGFHLGRLLGARPAPGGFSGQNIILTTTKGKGEYVLRGRPHYEWQFQRERFFARIIHEETDVPASWPYFLEQDQAIFGWAFAVMPLLPGLQPAHASVSDTDRLAIARALGIGLARLQDATRSYTAIYDPSLDALKPRDAEPGPLPMWTWWGFTENVERFLDRCVGTGVVVAEDAAWTRYVLNSNMDALSAPFTPTLVHHDYKEANVVVRRDGDGWKVSRVFDLAEAYFGDPEEDLVRPILSYASYNVEAAREFIASYATLRPLRTGFRERFRLYMLRDCLLVWEWSRQSERRFFEGFSFRQWAEPFVSLDAFGSAR